MLTAEPGAGKTTRVPVALLREIPAGEILVLEPRRIAARLPALRVAEELGEKPGETVGWQIRFEEVGSPATRIRFVTEGILTRRLASDRELRGVAAVLVDELHERSLAADLALARLAELRRTSRSDLRVVAMSATLDSAAVAEFLGGEVIEAPGRTFPVEVEYEDARGAAPNRALSSRVAAAVRRILESEPVGDVLVFLPGAREIRDSLESCADAARASGAELLPLHGELPDDEQRRALSPSQRRKVILSTNVAETSVTIPGVRFVVDSGLARVALHSPWSGLPRLETRPISRASAAQRAGRAGRTAPGRAIRLYAKGDHDSRAPFDVPEVRRADLAEAVLSLAAAGLDARTFRWYEAPPEAAIASATDLLRRLGALDGDGLATPRGRELLRLPLHPRLGALALAATAHRAPRRGALAAALLAERDLVRDRRAEAAVAADSDLEERCLLFERAERERFSGGALRSVGIDVAAAHAVRRARDQIHRLLGGGNDSKEAPDALRLAALAAFPDRVAKRRKARSEELLLSGGGAARLAPSSVVRDAELLVALDAADPEAGAKSTTPLIRLASATSAEELFELFPDRIVESNDAVFDERLGRAEVSSRLLYDALVLEERRRMDPHDPAAAAAMAAAARKAGADSFDEPGALDRFRLRAAVARRFRPDIPEIDDALVDAALLALADGAKNFSEMRRRGLVATLRGTLPPNPAAEIDRLAPESVPLPRRKSVRVQYEAAREPFVESRLQDFFGAKSGPAIGGGKLPLVLHLLAPNGRAVQITTDLAGFWERHYPAIRKELSRRYPRHQWPEEPV